MKPHKNPFLKLGYSGKQRAFSERASKAPRRSKLSQPKMQRLCLSARYITGRVITSLGQLATGGTKIEIAEFGNRGRAMLEVTCVAGLSDRPPGASALRKRRRPGFDCLACFFEAIV